MWAWRLGVREGAAGGEPSSDWHQGPQRRDAHALCRQARFSCRHPGEHKWSFPLMFKGWSVSASWNQVRGKTSVHRLCDIDRSPWNLYSLIWPAEYSSIGSGSQPNHVVVHPLVNRSCALVCARAWTSWTATGKRRCTWPAAWDAWRPSKLCWMVEPSVTWSAALAIPSTVPWSTVRRGEDEDEELLRTFLKAFQ